MNVTKSLAAAVLITAVATSAAAWENPPDHEFTATAIMDTGEGTRQMPVTLIARSYTSIEDVARLETVLANGGQGALLATLNGMNNGRLRLGALELPVNLVAAEKLDDGYRYIFVTARRIQVEEVNSSSPSLHYPFGVAIFELGDFGPGEGQVYPAASLHIDDSDNSVIIKEYEGDPGRLEDVEKTR